MKKMCALLLVCVMLLFSFSVAPTAAHTDFDVQSGVLVKYNGSSENVTLPDYVTAVGASAFENNTTLQSVTMNASVYSIGDRAFSGCSSLQTVNGGEKIVEVGDLAFRGTPYLENSTEKYFMLGRVLLWYNGTSESVTIPSRCTAVAAYAFARCDYLKSFTAYEGLVSIGAGAFYNCTALSAVSLPATVSAVGGYAFEGTPFLTRSGTFATVGDGVLIRYQGSDTKVAIPDTVRRIAPHAFTSSKLSAVTVPESVYAIDAYAFSDCVGLKEISLSEGLVTIGDCAFRGCKQLESVKTPSSLAYIGQEAFHGASSLTSAAIRGSQLSVSYNAFKSCAKLNYVLLSNGVSSVWDNAFYGCFALEGISVPVEAKDLSDSALNGCTKAVVCCEENAAAKSVFSENTVNTVMGDADSDHSLNIIDATVIQFYVAYLKTLDGAQIASADVNFDGVINIEDAYQVQMKIAFIL